jgi:hypothetical protein
LELRKLFAIPSLFYSLVRFPKWSEVLTFTYLIVALTAATDTVRNVSNSMQ